MPFGEAHFHDAIKSKTRLGEDDRVLEFDPPLASPFGHRVRRLTLAAHLVHGLSDIDELKPRVTKAGFQLGDRTFIYDRLGLRPADDEPTNEATDA